MSNAYTESIEFYSEPNIKLLGVITTPRNAGSSTPGVVLCNGYMGLKGIYMPQLAEFLAEGGFTSLAFDYRGFGESGGIPYRPIPYEQIIDIRSAITYLSSRDDVDVTRLALWGTSLGGANAIVAAANDSRIQCVVANIPPANLARSVRGDRNDDDWEAFQSEVNEDRKRRVLGLESKRVSPLDIIPYDDDSRRAYEKSLLQYPERVKMRFPLEIVDHLMSFAPERYVDLIAPRPLLLISAENDSLTPPFEQQLLFERAFEPKQLVTISGATHYTTYLSPYFSEVMRKSLDFFTDMLL